MKKPNTFGPAQDYSSSETVAKLNRSDATIALGKRLTAQLGIDGSVDTLGRWMAHYVAELITRAEEEGPDDTSGVQRSCFDAILQLWKHRAFLPDGHRPLQESEPILNTLASLDPESNDYRYIRRAQKEDSQDKEDDSESRFLKMAEGIDYTARLLIRYFLALAAAPHQEEGSDWIKLALASGAEDLPAVVILPALDYEHRLMSGASREVTAAKLIRERIEKLEAFAALASQIASGLREDLDSSANPEPPS